MEGQELAAGWLNVSSRIAKTSVWRIWL